MLFGAPSHIIGSNRITEQSAKRLPVRGKGQEMRVQIWREENLNSLTMPYMGSVVEGKVDIVTDTPIVMCRKLTVPGKRWILNAPAKTFFLTPPEVSLSSAIYTTTSIEWRKYEMSKYLYRAPWCSSDTIA